MTELVGVYDLWNRHTNSFEEAQLYSPIAELHLLDYEQRWVPLVHQKIAHIQGRDALGAVNLQDFHWRWSEKVKERGGDLGWQSFAIYCGGLTQGLMFVNFVKRCRAPAQEGDHLVYVDLVSTAPWNRHGFTERPLYKGVGRIMLVAAVSLSVQEGFKGRIGLHSLPQSETWYRNTCCMTDLGPDEQYQKLHYFEMTPTQAEAFIGN